MDSYNNIKEWNELFLSLSIRIGEIYFRSLNMRETLAKVHKEKRWKWVNSDFVKKASRIYVWLLNHPEEREGLSNHSFESIFKHVDKTPNKPLLDEDNPMGEMLKLYLNFNKEQ